MNKLGQKLTKNRRKETVILL